MSDLVLFHSGYGLRPAVRAAAERIRALGWRVHTPDLYRGVTADTAEEGGTTRDGIGYPNGASDVEDDASFGYPIQLHIAERDEFAPVEEITDWVKAVEAKGGSPDVFWYAGGGHLYTDPGLPDYDADSAEQTWQRVEAFLTGLR